MKDRGVPEKYRIWVEARRKFTLSHAQIQMARELGMNPKKFGSLANNDQERWKAPLGEFIEGLYRKHFRKAAPDVIRSIEEMVKSERMKEEQRKARKPAKATEAEAGSRNGAEPESTSNRGLVLETSPSSADKRPLHRPCLPGS